METGISEVARSVGCPPEQVERLLELLDEGWCASSILALRSDLTGGLDARRIRRLREEADSRLAVERRRATVLKTIADLADAHESWQEQASRCSDLHELEDVMKAARLDASGGETGLEADPALRAAVRAQVLKSGVLHVDSVKGKEADVDGLVRGLVGKETQLSSVAPIRLLGIRRHEREGRLTVKVMLPDGARKALLDAWGKKGDTDAAAACLDGGLLEEIGDECRRIRKDNADARMRISAANVLHHLLSVGPLGPVPLLVIASAKRSSAHLVLVGAEGRQQAEISVSLGDGEKADKEIDALAEMWTAAERPCFAVGDGVAPRHAAVRIRERLRERSHDIQIARVCAVGIPHHAASSEGRRQHPKVSKTVRIALLLAERLRDPIHAYAAIPTRSLALVPYQGEVAPHLFEQALGYVWEEILAEVKVDPRVDPPDLLNRVPGLGRLEIERIRILAKAGKSVSSVEDLSRVEGLDSGRGERLAPFLKGDGQGPGRRTRQLPRLPTDRASLDELAEGEVVSGVVTHVEAYGAFVDIGLAVEGFVRAGDLFEGGGHRNAREILSVGLGVRVLVKAVHADKDRFDLARTRSKLTPRGRTSGPRQTGPRSIVRADTDRAKRQRGGRKPGKFGGRDRDRQRQNRQSGSMADFKQDPRPEHNPFASFFSDDEEE